MHIDGMPMIWVCHCEHEIKHRRLSILGSCWIISILLKHARSVSECIPDRGIELSNYRFEQCPSGFGHGKKLVAAKVGWEYR
jgi:hypothetical protein